MAAALPVIGHRLPEEIAHDARRDLPGFGHIARRRDVRCPAPASRFRIDMADAVLVQVREEIVCVPCRCAVSRMRVARPECQPQPALQFVRMLAEDTADFEHGGVGARIVHRPVVPRIHMPTEHDIPIFPRTGEVCGERGDGSPSGLDVRLQAHGDSPLLQESLERVAVLLANGDCRDLREIGNRLRGRGAPDGGDNHLVQPLRIDADHPYRACTVGRKRRPRPSQTIHQDDRAARVLIPRNLPSSFPCRRR